jgi:hypothetical protein
MQLLELHHKATAAAATGSKGGSSSSSSKGATSVPSGLKGLLQAIRRQWELVRARQVQSQALQRGQSQQQQSPPLRPLGLPPRVGSVFSDSGSGSGSPSPPAPAGEQWASGLDALAASHPSLSGFARMARNSSALLVSLS